MLRILILEDEERVSDFLQEALREVGYEVDICATVAAATQRAALYSYDLLIVDLMLPDGDGREFISSFRSTHENTPVLIVTAKGRLQDRISGLDQGADDYLTKPFALGELLARVRALLRRNPNSPPILTFGNLELDPSTRKVTQAGEPVYLSALQFNLLQHLIRHRGEILSKQDILEAIWDDKGFRDPNTVEAFVSQLRARLETKGHQRVIHTVRGAGYTAELRHDPS